MIDFIFGKSHLNILYFIASRRGGSTLLTQILESEPKTVSVDQPFDLWKPETKRGRLIKYNIPNKFKSQFFELNESEYQQIDLYLNKIKKRKLFDLNRIKPRPENIVLKIVNAHGLIDEFIKMVNGKVIVMLRHPCSQALSIIKNQWGTCEEPFLLSKSWSNKYLTQEQVAFSKEISANGTYLERAILNWCLEWHYILNYSKSNYHFLYYEDLVLKPKEEIDILFEYLNFKNSKQALKVINEPSRSSQYSSTETIENIKNNDKQFLISKWRKDFSEIELQKSQLILDIFKVSCYTVKNDLPIR